MTTFTVDLTSLIPTFSSLFFLFRPPPSPRKKRFLLLCAHKSFLHSAVKCQWDPTLAFPAGKFGRRGEFKGHLDAACIAVVIDGRRIYMSRQPWKQQEQRRAQQETPEEEEGKKGRGWDSDWFGRLL